MVRVTIEEGLELDIYATHMQSGPTSKYAGERNSQVEQLARFINRHSGSLEKSEKHIIVAGI
jgi:hypothetical protein